MCPVYAEDTRKDYSFCGVGKYNQIRQFDVQLLGYLKNTFTEMFYY